MTIKTIRQIKKLSGRRVLLRADFNVPLTKDFKVGQSEDYRLISTVPTIQYLMKKGAKVVILAHLGRPDGRVSESLRLDPVAVRLSQLLKKQIYKSDDVLIDPKFIDEQMKPGDVLLLENIRFDAREEKNDKNFAKQLAKLGDCFVNDAFSVSHRAHASVEAITAYLPAYAGLLMEKEIVNLTRAMKNPVKPLVTIIGGAKISTKMKLIERFLPLSQNVLLGGALANTALKALGVSVGQSLIESAMIREVSKIKLTENKLVLPIDGVMAQSFKSKTGRLDALADVKKNEVILDVGPDTLKLYGAIIMTARTIIWNGPMGLIEEPFFARGTKRLIKILAGCRAKVIVGGGETVQLIRKMKLEDEFYFISTGGGAMLEFLEGRDLPGLKKIMIK